MLGLSCFGALSESEGSGSDLRPGAERGLLLATDRLRLAMLLLLRLLLCIQKAQNESEVNTSRSQVMDGFGRNVRNGERGNGKRTGEGNGGGVFSHDDEAAAVGDQAQQHVGRLHPTGLFRQHSQEKPKKRRKGTGKSSQIVSVSTPKHKSETDARAQGSVRQSSPSATPNTSRRRETQGRQEMCSDLCDGGLFECLLEVVHEQHTQPLPDTSIPE